MRVPRVGDWWATVLSGRAAGGFPGRGGMLLLFAVAMCWALGVHGSVPVAQAQDARILPVEDEVYTYLNRLQRRGYLLELHPTALPYTAGEVRRAIERNDAGEMSSRERRWLYMVEQLAGLTGGDEVEEAAVGGLLQAGTAHANTDRQESLTRPVGEGSAVWTNAEGRIWGAAGPAIAQVGLRHDLYYDQDPDGISPVRRLKARNENSYVGLNTRWAGLYAGRFSNHWAMHGEQAGVLSANPRPFDQINFRVGGERLSVQGLIAELDNITSDDQFTGRARDAESRSRFFTASRLDWRPSKRLALTLQESIIYEGSNTGLSPTFLVPTHVLFFVGDNAPANALDQLLVSLSIWARFGSVTFHFQGVVDDFVLEDRAQLIEEERLQPTMFALYGSMRIGGVTDRLDLGFESGLASFQVYNSSDAILRYVFLNRGIANQFTDYVDGTAFADIYLDDLVPGLTLSPRISLLAQGEQRLNQEFVRNRPDGSIIETLLTGTNEYTARLGLQAFFQPDRRFFMRFDAGVNRTWNANHESGLTRTRFIGLLEVGARLSLSRDLSLSF